MVCPCEVCALWSVEGCVPVRCVQCEVCVVSGVSEVCKCGVLSAVCLYEVCTVECVW